MFLYHVHNDDVNATYLYQTLLPVWSGNTTWAGWGGGCRAKRITVIMKLAARGRSWLGHGRAPTFTRPPHSPAIFTIGFTYVYKFTVLMKSIGKHQYLNYQQSTSYVSTLTLCIIAVQTASLTPSRPRHPPPAGPRANILISRMPSGICGVQVQVGTTRTVIQVFYLLTSSNDLGCDLLLTLVCWIQRARQDVEDV